jgi:hypothetical protein
MTESKQTTARTKAGGWIKPTQLERSAVSGRPFCRWCQGEVAKGRRTFCSDTCVHEWKLRTNPGYLRDKVFERDKGVCAQCGKDTIALRRDMRKLDYAARRHFLKQCGTCAKAAANRSGTPITSCPSPKAAASAIFRTCAHFACCVIARRRQRYESGCRKLYFLNNRSNASRASLAFRGGGVFRLGTGGLE